MGETYCLVGDLYEAWALYQFGKLTVDVIGASLRRQDGGRSDEEAVQLSYEAVAAVVWLGNIMFVVVSIAQAGWCLWQWTFMDAAHNFTEYESTQNMFMSAGMLASAAAIYNVHTVEHTFARKIASYAPFLKFVSVKFLIFFTFWQKGLMQMLVTYKVVPWTAMQSNLLNSTLLVFECLLSAALHCWAWRPEEDWYHLLQQEKVKDEEQKPLLQEL